MWGGKTILLAVAGAIIVVTGIELPLANSLVGRGFACFFAGCILSAMYKTREGYVVSGAVQLSWLIFSLMTAVYVMWRIKGDGAIGNMQMAFIMVFTPCIIWVALFHPLINKLLSLGVFVWLGKISMGIYLWHFPVQCLIKCFEKYLNIAVPYKNAFFSFFYLGLVIVTAAFYERIHLRIESFYRHVYIFFFK